jgi:hypothetical protein
MSPELDLLSIARNRDLPSQARILYMHLCGLVAEGETHLPCEAGFYADALGFTRNVADIAMSHLMDAGLVRREIPRAGRQTVNRNTYASRLHRHRRELVIAALGEMEDVA